MVRRLTEILVPAERSAPAFSIPSGPVLLNYSLENERTDNDQLVHSGSWGSLVSGVKTRLGDSSSVYLEERYQTAARRADLRHATGINLVTKER